MTEQQNTNLPKIGYLFRFPKIDELGAEFRLDVYITSEPTEKHFDVFRMKLLAKPPDGHFENFHITHPWHYDKTAEVCAGVIVLEDRGGKKEEAFSFGGELTIDIKDSQTDCTLVSSAPILEISGATPLNGLFIEEV